MDYIEEKTPYGIAIKVLTKKWSFLAFDRNGSSIYADDAGLKVLHRVPLVSFVGADFEIKNNKSPDLSFLKVSKNQIIIPYMDLGENKRRYLFIHTLSKLDLMPVRLTRLRDISHLVREIEAGVKPDYIVVDKNITKNDIIIIKNRYSEAVIVLADKNEDSLSVEGEDPAFRNPGEGRAVDLIGEININMMSNNPVFLARVHLREMELSKVNQLILDFDLSDTEAEYILSFILTMLKKTDSEEIEKNRPRLESLRDSLNFYKTLLAKDIEGVHRIIDSLTPSAILASYSTMVAKVKLLYPGTDDQLLFTDIENLLWEKKEQSSDTR
ncbi:MAG TPA: hypothetical protein ENN21_01860 [Spirochaetes bacterium]|nr:hypothetical protein [Spirochaetota bacterium]